jgi:hypothetical protein
MRLASLLFVISLATACGGSSSGADAGHGIDSGNLPDGHAADAGPSSDGGYPAAHSAQPRVVNPPPGGPVLASPNVVPIFWTGQSGQSPASVSSFLDSLATSSYWTQTTSEYGVGPLTVGAAITLPNTAPTMLTDATLRMQLTSAFTGASDPNTIYMFVLPLGTTLNDGGACCMAYDGYHDEMTLAGKSVPYALVCNCPGFDGPMIGDSDQLAAVMSHEIVEAVTDPHPSFHEAFGQTDDNDWAWTILTGGEVADMCTFIPNWYIQLDGSTAQVSRSWSNAAAAAGTDPCVPVPAGEVYFNSSPVLPDMVNLQGTTTKGVMIPQGTDRTVDVQLWSDGPEIGPWQVTAYDMSSDFLGGAQELSFTWDKTSGSNGDTLKLTIHVVAADSQGGEVFVVESKLGPAYSAWSVGTVGQ